MESKVCLLVCKIPFRLDINPSPAGESKRFETAVAISNLSPGHLYHVCVSAVSAANFQTSSAVLHVRTKQLSQSQTQDSSVGGGPIVRAYIPKAPAAVASPAAPIMSREHSGGQLQGKRAVGGRKTTTTGLDLATHAPGDEHQKTTIIDDADE